MKFKELMSKLNEKNELGTPETTKNYASATPGQGNVVFTPDTKYDGIALAKELDPSGSIEKQVSKARNNMDIDADGDVDAMDKKNDNIPDEVTGAEKKNLTLALIKKGAAERSHTKKGVAYEGMDLKKAKMGDVIKDFRKSDAPQFAGKSDEKKREMAIAAKLSANDEKNEEVEVDERNKENAMKRKNMDASRGARFKVQGGTSVPDREPQHKTGVAHNKSIGRAIRQMSNEEKDDVEEATYHDSGWKKSTGQRKDSSGNVIKNFAKHLAKKGAAENDPNRKLRSDEKKVNGKIKREDTVREEKDDREYGYEGDMAITQLKTIMRHADHMKGMLKPETDLPEWVQSKITLATDYMQTAHDYMMSEMTESYDGRVLGRITSKEINKVLGPTKNAAQGVEALKKAFKVTDAQAKVMLNRMMKESVEQIDESEDKTIGRLKQLVRFGLMDKSKLAILSRSMKSLEKGQVTNPTERATLFELLNELIGLVTADDAMFAKVRMNVQKSENQIRNEEFDKKD